MNPHRLLPAFLVSFCFAYLSLSPLALAADDNDAAAKGTKWQAGVAKLDITPTETVWLSGYAARSTPTSEIADRLFVRALFLKPASGADLMIVSMDAVGVAPWMTQEISQAASDLFGMSRAQIVVCSTHSHTAPHLDGYLVNLFGGPQSKEDIDATKRYTRFVVDQAIAAMKQAGDGLRDSVITIGQTSASFAINRRPFTIPTANDESGLGSKPVDHRVRILKVESPSGEALAVAFQYACHCTSIDPGLNKVSADWAGLAAAGIERELGGAIALPIIGTGADSNPNPRGAYEHALAHGDEVATAVLKELPAVAEQLPAPSVVSFSLTPLEFEPPTESLIEARRNGALFQERYWADRLDESMASSEGIPKSYPAPAHFWGFGSDLAWVFLGGEVVVDFQIRFEQELDSFSEVWVAGYVDDVFSYVTSERVRNEGGYEVDSSMLYYNRPGRWVSGTEQTWVEAVLKMQTP